MVCPNKTSKAWTDLLDGIKEKLKSEGKSYEDKEVEDLANIAFHRYGDIPRNAEHAFDYLLKKVNREEVQFERWVNFGKGQFIRNQGELTIQDLSKSFPDRFGIEPTEEQMQSIYNESEKSYKINKIKEGLIANQVAETQEKKGGKPIYNKIIPRIKDYFSSNFNILGKESPESKDAAAQYFSSAAQAASLIKLAVGDIAKRFGKQTWIDLRKALVQSRLDGIRERWGNMAEAVRNMSDIELINKFDKENYTELLKEINGRNPLANLVDEAKTLIENDDFQQLKTLVSGAFEYAQNNVAKVDFSDGRTYEQIKSDPNVKAALDIYKNTIEKPLNESHASNEGVFSDSLGELNTYYPLIPIDENGNLLISRKKGNLKSGTKNMSNRFATGLSNAYDIAVDKLNTSLTQSIKTNNKANFINTMEKAGMLKMLSPFEAGSDTITINGIEHPAETIEAGTAIIKDGKLIPAQKVLVPKWLAMELKPLLEKDRMNPTMFNKFMNTITKVSLGGPFEAAIHSTNLLGALVNGTPYAGTSIFSKSIGNTPLTKIFTGLFNIINEDVESPASIKHIQEMAKVGLIPEKSGTYTRFADIAESTGIKKIGKNPLEYPTWALYGRKGMDIKARVLMDRICLEINPDATPEQRRQFSYQLGNYTRGLEGQLEKTLKKTGVAPFFTASSTFLKNGIKGWLGMNPLPTEGQSFGKKATMRAAQMLSAGSVGIVSTWAALYLAKTGKWPWEDKNSNFLKIPLTQDEKDYAEERPWLKGILFKNGKWQDVNMGFFNSVAQRGAKALGINALYDTNIQGGDVGEVAEAVQKDMLNSFLVPMVSAPSIHLMTTAATGNAPYINSLRDNLTGKPKVDLQRTVRTMENGLSQMGANVAQGFLNINPLIEKASENFGLDFRPKYAKEDENSWKAMSMITDMVMPYLFKSHIDNDKKSAQLKSLSKKVKGAAEKEQKFKEGKEAKTIRSRSMPGIPRMPR
jgi:hypothetical protein